MKNAETLMLTGFCRLLEDYKDYDKSAFYLPWQHLIGIE